MNLDNAVIDLQSSVTELKELVVRCVMNGESEQEIKMIAATIIKRASKKLGPQLGYERVARTLLNTFNSDYFMLQNNMKMINNAIKAKGYELDLANADNRQVVDANIRGFRTDLEHGRPIVKDYQKLVREQLKTIAAIPPIVPLTDKNGKAYTMSGRNYAEMTIRYQAQCEDVEKLKTDGVKLVWISSHADASPRCAPYQGKLYSVDGGSGITAHGEKYTPLAEAMAGPKGDGNGIVSGYNCRHYLIPYEPGSKPPIDYDKKKIKLENAINNKQRYYENRIRQLKTEERLARASEDKKLAQTLNKRWKKLNDKYEDFSLSNHRPVEHWRTVVSRSETI